jgi:hypothetical protein
MWVVKDSTSKQTQRQTVGREGSQVGMGSAPSGVPCIMFCIGLMMAVLQSKHVALM